MSPNQHRNIDCVTGTCVTQSNSLIDDMLAGKDLIVVLNNRYHEAYVEHLHLSTIILWQDQFVAKIDNIHSGAGLPGIEAKRTVAYAYNNFCPVVSCCSLDVQKMRLYSTYAYSHIQFFCRRKHQRVWTSERPKALGALLKSFIQGGSFKALIAAADGYIYILTIQIIKIDKDNNTFTAETAYDAVPVLFKSYQHMTGFGEKMDGQIASCMAPSYPAGVFKGPIPFFSLSFIISPEKIMHRQMDVHGTADTTTFAYRKVELWSDAL